MTEPAATPSSSCTPKRALAWLKEESTRAELLSGITVALAQIPEAVAFSLVAGVKPQIGLTAAWIVGLVTALAGGRPGQISGATGALAVVLTGMADEHGEGYIFMTVVLMGVLQTLLGLLGAGKLVRMIPSSVMIGFCNGLAIIIGMAQLHSFKVDESGEGAAERRERRLGGGFAVFSDGVAWVGGAELAWMLLITVVCMAVCLVAPKITKKVPSSLLAIVMGLALEHGLVRPLGYATRTVGDVASVSGSFPIPVWFDDQFDVPNPFGTHTDCTRRDAAGNCKVTDVFSVIFPTAVTMALVGLIESLMTLELIDTITDTRGDTNRECLGQGLANVITGVFGGMGGCAMIGQSMINIKSGARKRLSAAFAAVMLLVIMLAIYPLINLIPTAALVGVMFIVVYLTFEWHSLKLLAASSLPKKARAHGRINSRSKVKRSDAFVIVLVTVVTLFTDLAVAVITGIIFSSLVYAWDSGNSLTANVYERVDKVGDKGTQTVKVYELRGPIFFASTKAFREIFSPASDPDRVEIHFQQSSVCDYSALVALNELCDKYKKLDKQVRMKQMSMQSCKLLTKAQDLVKHPEMITLEFAVTREVVVADVELEPTPTVGGAFGGGEPARGTRHESQDDKTTVGDDKTAVSVSNAV